MRRKLNVKRHITAFILTLCFFTIGILIGSQLTSERVKFLQEAATEQAIDFESLQAQYLYVSFTKDNRSCAAVEQTFEANVQELEDTRKQLENFVKSSQINEKAYTHLKRQYIISQVRYYILAKSTQEICNTDIVTAFYFFSNDADCADCTNQGTVLTYLKRVFTDRLLIFSFDGQFEQEPFIPILKKVYNVSEYPTVAIENKNFNGLQDRDTLLKEICTNFEEEYSECEAIPLP